MAPNATFLWLAAALALTACGPRPAQDGHAAAPAPDHVIVSSVEVARLAADRAALDDAHAHCKARAANATPQLCAAAAEATRRRFSGSPQAYTPAPVDPFPSAAVDR